MSTVKIPPVLPSPRDDAMQIYRSFKGTNTDATTIINILAHRGAAQRGQIQHEYHTMYSENLRKRLKTELNGQFKKAVILWMYEPGARDARIVKKALKGTVQSAKDHKVYTWMICSRTWSQIGQLKRAYYTNIGNSLEAELESEASGEHKKLLLAFISAARYEGPEYDEALVEEDAKALHKATKKFGLEEKTFIKIFSERSSAHLAAINVCHKKLYKKPLDKVIRDEAHKTFVSALKTIIRCAESPETFYAKTLREAMKFKGLISADKTLIRIIITTAEIDLYYVKAEYKKMNGKTLNDAVHSETSGHYRAFLLALLGDNN